MRKEYDGDIDFDSNEAMVIAENVLRNKKCLHDIYVETYKKMMRLKEKYLTGGKDILEIGSGGGFIKDVYPYVVTSDVQKTKSDIVVNAESLPFQDNSLDAIFAHHCLHHIPNIYNFFNEAQRCLRGGGIICVEPYYGPVAQFVYKKFHSEPFDEKAKSWKLNNNSGGPMTSSNQALSYIIFKRDYKTFKMLYPNFDLVYQESFGFIRYMMTGGLWLKQFVPDFAFPVLKGLEFLLKPLMPIIAIHHVFCIRKK